MKKILFKKLTVKETMHITGGGDTRELQSECGYVDGEGGCVKPDSDDCYHPLTPGMDCTSPPPDKETCSAPV